jgi:hypothetical protein
MTDEKSVDLILLMSLCGETEPPYWRVDGAALMTDEVHVGELEEAFFMSIHYYADVRLVTVQVTFDEAGKPSAKMMQPDRPLLPEIMPWLF